MVPPEALETVMAMEADRMTGLRITPEAFAEVQRIVRQNRERAGNTPIVRGMQQLYADAFEGHPYAWPAIGREEDLGALTLDDCLAWHRARYGPGNAIVTVTGRFTPEDAIAAARRTLGRVPRRDTPRDPKPSLPGEGAVRRTTGTYVFPGASVLLGWRVPGAPDADATALELLARCLSGGSGAPLERSLLGQGRPTVYVHCGMEARREAGLFFALAALQAGADSAAVATVERTMLDEIAKVAKEGVQAERLQRARKALQVDRLFSLQRPRDRAAALGRGELVTGRGPAALQAAAAPVTADAAAVTADAAAVQAVAARLLASRTPVTVWMMPAGAPDREGTR
jgi:zinc protease